MSVCKSCSATFKREKGGASRLYCSECKPGQGFKPKNYPEKPCISCKENFKPTSSTHTWCKVCREDDRWQRMYGISRVERDRIFEKFNGKCHLCDRPANRIDHDHVTGRVRGALCGACNVAISSERFENPEWRKKALEYIGH